MKRLLKVNVITTAIVFTLLGVIYSLALYPSVSLIEALKWFAVICVASLWSTTMVIVIINNK